MRHKVRAKTRADVERIKREGATARRKGYDVTDVPSKYGLGPEQDHWENGWWEEDARLRTDESENLK